MGGAEEEAVRTPPDSLTKGIAHPGRDVLGDDEQVAGENRHAVRVVAEHQGLDANRVEQALGGPAFTAAVAGEGGPRGDVDREAGPSRTQRARIRADLRAAGTPGELARGPPELRPLLQVPWAIGRPGPGDEDESGDCQHARKQPAPPRRRTLHVRGSLVPVSSPHIPGLPHPRSAWRRSRG